MAIDNEADALRFYDGCVAHLEAQPDRKDPADCVAKANIGWCFGEGMDSDRVAMWRKVCGASHPVFGPMTTKVLPEEAFAAGQQAAQK
jgi:hypothetical protein